MMGEEEESWLAAVDAVDHVDQVDAVGTDGRRFSYPLLPIIPSSSAIHGAARPVGTSTARCLRASFIDGERSALERLAIEGIDGGLGLGSLGHLDESEASRLVGVAVLDDGHQRHFSVCSERLAQIVLGCCKRQIPYVNVHPDLLIRPFFRADAARAAQPRAGQKNQKAADRRSVLRLMLGLPGLRISFVTKGQSTNFRGELQAENSEQSAKTAQSSVRYHVNRFGSMG